MTFKLGIDHPGIRIGQLMRQYNITMEKDLAALLEISPARCNRLLLGKMSVTPDTALRLATCFPDELGSTDWLNLQAHYDINQAKSKHITKLTLKRLKRRALTPLREAVI